MENWLFIDKLDNWFKINKQTWTIKNPKLCKNGYLIQKWLFNTEMVIYLIWSQQVATWPIFPLISHNDLQTSISNMASSTSFTFLFSLSFTFFHPYFPSFTFIFLRTSSFAFINLHLRSLFLIHLHSNSFTFIHTHPSSLIFIHLHRPSFTFAFFHLHLPSSSSISLHLPPVAFIHLHSLAFLYLHTPTSTTISLHLPSSTSVGFHDSPEIIQRIVVPSHYSFLTNLFPCPLIFRHYTYSKIILHFRETYRILHCFVIQQGLNEVYIFPTDLTFWPYKFDT